MISVFCRLIYVNEIAECRAAGKTRVHSSKLAGLHSAPESCSTEHWTPAGINRVWHQWTWHSPIYFVQFCLYRKQHIKLFPGCFFALKLLYLVGFLRCYFSDPQFHDLLDFYLSIYCGALPTHCRLLSVDSICTFETFFQTLLGSRTNLDSHVEDFLPNLLKLQRVSLL